MIAHVVPTRTVEITPPSDSIPSGFGTWNAPPGAGRFSRTGFTTTPTAVRAVATTPIATIGRHRREGSVPLGKKNKRKAIETAVGTNTPDANAPTTAGPRKNARKVGHPPTA